MSKLIVCALMGMSVFFVGSASAQSLTVNEGIASTCDASVLYKQYVCQGGLVDAVQRYDELFKPPAAYLNPVVSDDKGGSSGGGAFDNTGSGGGDTGGGGSSNEDFMSDGFQ
ncbi:hypothetical protein CC99x_005405 [Candidatus Berkiella cookevillensis]|uniref:Uncharacterized protein n=1 Tax=Candidatus Berkiella cookevillensis TaxID=437022 RepID=A0A0Q9YT27_9GAMM|nr:hypothetical protein [Candidatus Berkiella cookevillensis]MCS5708338.1 hypothetical protein [Candidatus Berkiella cookevillensis]